MADISRKLTHKTGPNVTQYVCFLSNPLIINKFRQK